MQDVLIIDYDIFSALFLVFLSLYLMLCLFLMDNWHCNIQSNLHKTTTLGTTQKWSSWAGGCLVKHLYKTFTKQMLFLAGFFGFFLHSNIGLNKDLQLSVLVQFLKIFKVTFHCESTYTKKWEWLFHLILGIMQLWHPQKMTK